MPRCTIDCTIHITARLRNCGYKSGEITHDAWKYILKFICFIYKIILIIYWDIYAFRSFAPDKVDRIMIVRPVNGMAREHFMKMPMVLPRPYLTKKSKDENLPMDYNWTPQMDSTIISVGPATCSITPSPAGTRPANPSRWCSFCPHSAIFMVKCTPELTKITFLWFVRPFPGDSRNIALTVIIGTNICVIGVIVAMNVKRPIYQKGSGPECDSVTTHIHDWTRHFSFWIKNSMSKLFILV
jgi:hypothetical protein